MHVFKQNEMADAAAAAAQRHHGHRRAVTSLNPLVTNTNVLVSMQCIHSTAGIDRKLMYKREEQIINTFSRSCFTVAAPINKDSNFNQSINQSMRMAGIQLQAKHCFFYSEPVATY